jgi:uncharacterized protein YdcH (DUF465 family)
MASPDALKEELIQTDAEYRRLHSEHQECERRLQDIYQKSFLSQEDEIQEKQIKLRKLQLKDRMQQILRSHREQRVPV